MRAFLLHLVCPSWSLLTKHGKLWIAKALGFSPAFKFQCQVSWRKNSLSINNPINSLFLISSYSQAIKMQQAVSDTFCMLFLMQRMYWKSERISLKVNYKQLKGYFCISHLLDKGCFFITIPEYKLSCKPFKMWHRFCYFLKTVQISGPSAAFTHYIDKGISKVVPTIMAIKPSLLLDTLQPWSTKYIKVSDSLVLVTSSTKRCIFYCIFNLFFSLWAGPKQLQSHSAHSPLNPDHTIQQGDSLVPSSLWNPEQPPAPHHIWSRNNQGLDKFQMPLLSQK